jgi:hypothetical protein
MNSVTLDELDGMEIMDVFSKRWFTLDELRKKGIKNRPMPVGLIYDIKRDPSGSWDKDKSCLVMRGHQWNMSISFGFDHKYGTFAATPDLATTRMMQAIKKQKERSNVELGGGCLAGLARRSGTSQLGLLFC